MRREETILTKLLFEMGRKVKFKEEKQNEWYIFFETNAKFRWKAGPTKDISVF